MPYYALIQHASYRAVSCALDCQGSSTHRAVLGPMDAVSAARHCSPRPRARGTPAVRTQRTEPSTVHHMERLGIAQHSAQHDEPRPTLKLPLRFSVRIGRTRTGQCSPPCLTVPACTAPYLHLSRAP